MLFGQGLSFLPSMHPSIVVTHLGTNHNVFWLTLWKGQSLYPGRHKSQLPQHGCRNNLHTQFFTFPHPPLPLASSLVIETAHSANPRKEPRILIPATGVWRWWWCHLSSYSGHQNVAFSGSSMKSSIAVTHARTQCTLLNFVKKLITWPALP